MKFLVMKSDFQDRRVKWLKRLLIVISITVLNVLCFFSVNLINNRRPSSVFYEFHTIIDSQIPYISWTWIFYYFGDIFVTVWAAIILFKLSEIKFRRAIYAYTGMIITGALLQITLPGKAPWPNDLVNVQQFVHNLISMRPYACLPSMHVALSVLPVCILYSVFKSIWIRIFSTLLAVLITVSTLTLKEHYFLDALAGLLLALIFYGFWRGDLKNFIKKQKV